jgi:competence protein ComEC
VAGIVAIAPAVRRRLTALPRPVAEGVAMTVAATLATAPLMAAHFEAVSPAALPANVLALPAVAPAMWLGMLAVAAGQMAALGPAFEWVSDVLAGALGWLAAVPLEYLSGLASWFASLSWAQLEVPALSPAGVVAAFGVLGAGCLAAARVSRRAGTRTAVIAGSIRTLGRSHRAALLTAGVGVACLVSLPLVESPDPPRNLTVRFLDVGQGDATLIQDPSGASVLFDGGREEARVAGLLRQAGVSRLALVVATHQSADHHGGLAEVLARYPVDLLLENGDGTTDPTFLAMLATARRAGVPITTARGGQVLRAGGLVVRVLWPPPRPPGPAPEDPNPRAMVAIVSSGAFDLFLSADAESPTLLPLDLPPVDAMKVPHHGSSDPGLPELLTRLRPAIAAIEVGADNSYGHPHPSTLAALHGAGVTAYRTDRDGTVTLTVAGGTMAVDTER